MTARSSPSLPTYKGKGKAPMRLQEERKHQFQLPDANGWHRLDLPIKRERRQETHSCLLRHRSARRQSTTARHLFRRSCGGPSLQERLPYPTSQNNKIQDEQNFGNAPSDVDANDFYTARLESAKWQF
ncbi:Hypothetical predicted protein [Lecanosticta acicola]|uniref:Uncharacterized protein n=1 Tax=Lecanosticta acicola TaxID=111012 RepID=A0AAI9E8V4_9PEZI|nr:Hypothetical predicted protein [Lecanosticta acicola]